MLWDFIIIDLIIVTVQLAKLTDAQAWGHSRNYKTYRINLNAKSAAQYFRTVSLVAVTDAIP